MSFTPENPSFMPNSRAQLPHHVTLYRDAAEVALGDLTKSYTDVLTTLGQPGEGARWPTFGIQFKDKVEPTNLELPSLGSNQAKLRIIDFALLGDMYGSGVGTHEYLRIDLGLYRDSQPFVGSHERNQDKWGDPIQHVDGVLAGDNLSNADPYYGLNRYAVFLGKEVVPFAVSHSRLTEQNGESRCVLTREVLDTQPTYKLGDTDAVALLGFISAQAGNIEIQHIATDWDE